MLIVKSLRRDLSSALGLYRISISTWGGSFSQIRSRTVLEKFRACGVIQMGTNIAMNITNVAMNITNVAMNITNEQPPQAFKHMSVHLQPVHRNGKQTLAALP